MRISIEATGLRDLEGRFQRFAETGADEALSEGVREVTQRVYDRAKQNIRSLFNTSGRMENALQMAFSEAGRFSIGSVSITGIGYVTQEFGGRKPFVEPKGGARPGHALMFEGEAGQVFAPYVVRGPLPSRSYLRLALEQTRAEIDEAFAGRVRAKLVR